MEACAACQSADAPTHRGVALCHGCTLVLLRQLQHPRTGMAKVVRSRSYARACKICGEYADRRLLEHPEWGTICEIDVQEAAELHRIVVQ